MTDDLRTIREDMQESRDTLAECLRDFRGYAFNLRRELDDPHLSQEARAELEAKLFDVLQDISETEDNIRNADEAIASSLNTELEILNTEQKDNNAAAVGAVCAAILFALFIVFLFSQAG